MFIMPKSHLDGRHDRLFKKKKKRNENAKKTMLS